MQSTDSQGCRANLSQIGSVGAFVLLRFGPVVLRAKLIHRVERLGVKHNGTEKAVRLLQPAFTAQVFYQRAYHPELCPDTNGNLESCDAGLKVDRATGRVTRNPALPKTVLVWEDDLHPYLPEFEEASVRLREFGWEFTDGMSAASAAARRLRTDYAGVYERGETAMPGPAHGFCEYGEPVRLEDPATEIGGMFREYSGQYIDPEDLEGLRISRLWNSE